MAGVTLVASLVLLDEPGSILVLLLGGLAVVLLRDRPAPSDDDVPTEDEPSSSRWIPRAMLGRTLVERPITARRPRREPALWPLTMGMLIVIGVAGVALDQATGGVDPRIVVDLALVAVGGVLALSAWRGRAGITVVALVGLVPLWLATSVPDIGRSVSHSVFELCSPVPAPVDPPTFVIEPTIGLGTLEISRV